MQVTAEIMPPFLLNIHAHFKSPSLHTVYYAQLILYNISRFCFSTHLLLWSMHACHASGLLQYGT
jgi:hypothetical protein